jgi:hypothetical protein
MLTGILLSVLLFSVVLNVTTTPKYDPSVKFTFPRCYTDSNCPIASKHLLSSASVFQTMRSRLKFHRQLPISSYTNKTLSLIAILLISISCDVESNPGPSFPCGTCGIEVLDEDPAVECDHCSKWYHISCQNLDANWYKNLVEHETSFVWSCNTCEHLNHTSSSSILSISTHNSFSSVQNENPPRTNINDSTNKTFINKLKIICINCQSIINKKLEFQCLIEKEKPDIVAGTESWLKTEHYNNEIFPPELGYSVFRNDRLKGKGGGVFLLVKSNLLASEQPQFRTDCEIIWVKLEIKGCKALYIASYYRPHESDINSLFEFEKSLNLTSKLKGNKLILGDFNFPKFTWDSDHIPSIKPGPCPHTSIYDRFIEIINDHNMTQMVSECTRQANILDLFLTTNPSFVNKTSILSGIGDHDIISTTVNVRPNILKQKPRNVPLFKKTNWQEFKAFMENSKLSILQNCDALSVEELWVRFRQTIELGISKFVPHKKLGHKKALPWITKEIKKLMHKRDKLYQKMKKNYSNSEIKNKLKTIKINIRHKIKHSHTQYLENILDIACHSDPDSSPPNKCATKKLYSLIKNSKQDSQAVSPIKDQSTGTMKTNNIEKANILNKQFQSVFTSKSPLSLKQCCMKQLSKLLPSGHSQYSHMPDITIDRTGLLKLLANLKPDKAAGPDRIRPVILKELRNEIVDVLVVLFQKSLSTGTIPADWSKAFVCPLFKKGDSSDPANYRPISLTCILCKTLEHIVASHVSAHLTQNNILYELQHGFREKRSCETQLIELTDDLMRNMCNRKQTDLILLDFSKAFDKVNHFKLLLKLQEYGISSQILKWSEAFLLNRTQSVVLEGDHSHEAPVTSGVPQGSVLGPLYFLVYINDLPNSIQSQVRLFADDTAVYLTINSPLDSKILQDDLHALEKWETEWDMEFNPSKCQVLHITKNKSVKKTKYVLHGYVLEAVTNAKYLGVDITTDLNWSSHINRISTNANKTLGFIKRNITTHNEHVKSLAYKTLIRPQLEYASPIWHPYTQSNTHKVEMVQRRAIRWVTRDFSPLSSVSQMQSRLGWRSLEYRRLDARLVMFHKIFHHHVAISIPSYIQKPSRFTRLMHPYSLRQVQVNTDYHKFSFFPHTVVLWNNLPSHIVTISDLDSFKAAVASIQY